MSWADRFTTWYHRRKAELLLRSHGICPVHFTEMKESLGGPSGKGGGYKCELCDKEARVKRKQAEAIAIVKLKQLKELRNVPRDSGRAVPEGEGN